MQPGIFCLHRGIVELRAQERVVGRGKSEGHVWNDILAAGKQEAELILGKPQCWRGPQPMCCPRNAVALDCSHKELLQEAPRQRPVSQECCGSTVLL